MKAGRLRHWLTFQVLAVDTDSETGIQDEFWAPAFDINWRMPVDVVALSGRELIAAQSVHSKVSTRIVARYRPGFTARMRAWFQDPDLLDAFDQPVYPGTTVYNIEAVIPDPDSRRRHVTLLCSDGVSDGK